MGSVMGCALLSPAIDPSHMEPNIRAGTPIPGLFDITADYATPVIDDWTDEIWQMPSETGIGDNSSFDWWKPQPPICDGSIAGDSNAHPITDPMIPLSNDDSMPNHLEQLPSTVPGNPITPIVSESSAAIPTRAKRRQPRLSQEAKLIFQGFYAHTPYPTAADYTHMAMAARTDENRVRNWFTNTRSREPDSSMTALTWCTLLRNSLFF